MRGSTKMATKYSYNKDIDYMKLIQDAVAAGNYQAAALFEQQRNAKILGEGLDYETTNQYQQYLNEKPTYTSTRQPQIDSLIQTILSTPQFSYDHKSDPLYSQYAKTYSREGQRAMQDTLGNVAAMTGGIPSSYATTAAAQANNYYMGKLADVIPQLEQLAYGRYQDDLNTKINQLNILNQQEQMDYARYLDSLDQYNRDRSFDYAKYLDELEQQRYIDERDYLRERDRIADERYIDERDYNRQQDAIQNKLSWARLNESQKSEYKPTLTAAQVLSAIKSGVTTPEVLAAYEYYYGEPYSAGPTPTGGPLKGSDEWFENFYEEYGENSDIMLNYYYEDLGLTSSEANKLAEGFKTWKKNRDNKARLDEIAFSIYEGSGTRRDPLAYVKSLPGYTDEEKEYMIRVIRELLDWRNQR